MNDKLQFEDIKSFFLQFKSLHKKIHEFTSKKNKVAGLSGDQCYLLFLIEHSDHPNQKMLAQHLKITPATLSVRLQRLEKAGYIERMTSIEDKRNVTLHTTNAGKNEIKECKEHMRYFIDRLFDGISKEDLNKMKEYCEIFEQNINKMKEELDVKD